jgi:hypothetical protein
MERNTKEAVTNNETRKHIANVAKFTNILIRHLQNRVMEHDATKMESPELESFTEHTALLKNSTYGSKEYNERLAGALKPALDHHYAKNRHHPEHWEHGVDDMDLVDIIEMFCDWKSATLRHNDGNLQRMRGESPVALA